MISGIVRVDLKRLRQFKSAGNSDKAKRAYKVWAAIYRSFVQRRFVAASRGSGPWPPLSPVTLARRRRGRNKKGLSAAILRDTGTLFNALDPAWSGRPGAIQEDIPYGVRVGFGGPSKYARGGLTIADIAKIHQLGLGNCPVRTIIVKPDAATVRQMSEVMKRALL